MKGPSNEFRAKGRRKLRTRRDLAITNGDAAATLIKGELALRKGSGGEEGENEEGQRAHQRRRGAARGTEGRPILARDREA